MTLKTLDINKISNKDHIIFSPNSKVFIAYNKETKSVIHNENSKTRAALIDYLDGFYINEPMIEDIEEWIKTYVYKKITNSTPLGLEEFRNEAIQVVDSILISDSGVNDDFDFSEIECPENKEKDAMDIMLENEIAEIIGAINVIAKSVVKITDHILKGDI